MLLIFKEFKRFCSFLVLLSIFIGCQKNKKQTNDSPLSFSITGKTQGTTYSIKYFAFRAKISKNSIDSLLKDFDNSLSTYLPNSKISKINAGDSTIILDHKIITTFKASEKIYNETNGLFDPTVGILVNAYGFGPIKPNNTISKKIIDSLMPLVGFSKVSILKDLKIKKSNPAIYFDFNAIAQGYSVDVVADFLINKGIENFIVEIGGEIRADGKNIESEKSWIVGIEDPTKTHENRTILKKVKLNNLSLATSGNYRKIQTDSISGKKYVHTINPKTGQAEKSNMLSVTILSEKCIDADGYATALMLMKLEEAKTFLRQKPTLCAFLVYENDNNKIMNYATENLMPLLVE